MTPAANRFSDRTTAAGVAGAGGATIGAVVALVRPYLGAAVGVLAVATAVSLAALPALRETAHRSRALGAAPDLVCLVVLSLRLEPALERATAFASQHGDGALADSLAAHAREARGRPTAGFTSFASTWSDGLPALRRAAALADAAVDAPAGDRERLLDRTLGVVLDGTRERAGDYADAVHGPTMAVYAFGVVLPLALVGVVPAAASAGLPLTLGALALGYGLVLPLGVLAVTAWVLARRPVAFPPGDLPADHPALAGRGRVAVLAAAGGFGATLLAGRVLPSWALPVLAVGWSLGAGLAAWSRPACAVRERARDVESGLADALSVVGHRLRQGASVEAAVADAGETVDGATGEVFAAAAGQLRRLRVDVETAFRGEHGALSGVPSQRAGAVVTLVTRAADAGPAGGRVLVDVAGLFDDLAALDRETAREFASTTRTLRYTALVYAPLVAGVTVALADRVAGFDGGSALPQAGLALVVGAYVLWLAVLLPALAVGLDRGLDRSIVGYHAGQALASAAAVYPVTAMLAGRVV